MKYDPRSSNKIKDGRGNVGGFEVASDKHEEAMEKAGCGGPLGVTGPSSLTGDLYNYTGPYTQKKPMTGLKFWYLHLEILNFILELMLWKF